MRSKNVWTTKPVTTELVTFSYIRQWRIQRGRNSAPYKIGWNMFLIPISFIRMFNNKAQIAQETIKTTLEFPGPLSEP